MNIVGYTCHVVNDKDFIDLGASIVIYENKNERKKLKDLISELKPKSTIIFYNLCDVGRTQSELDNIIHQIKRKNINIITMESLRGYNSPVINTTKNDYFFDVFFELSTFRRTKQSESINEGMKKSTKKSGRTHTHDPQIVNEAIEYYYKNNVSWDDISIMYGISASTLYRAHQKYKKNRHKL